MQHLKMSSDAPGADPSYSAKMIEAQTEQIMELSAANEELDRRSQACEKKWADLIDENLKNAEQVAQYKSQLEQQRETYTKVLELTERRVIQANVQISQLHSEFADENRK